MNESREEPGAPNKESLPTTSSLAGRTIMVTRALDQSAGFAKQLETRGAIPFLFPTIKTVPVDLDADAVDALRNLSMFDCVVFTSANGVRYFFEALERAGVDPGALEFVEVASVGTATAAALTTRGVTVSIIPEQFIAESLAEALAEQLPPASRILIPRPRKTRETLGPELVERGFDVREIVLYETVPDDSRVDAAAQALRAGRIDAITFTSGSTARNFVNLLRERIDLEAILEHVVVAVIGPATARVAEDVGLRVDVMPDENTTAAMIEALEKHFRARSSSRGQGSGRGRARPQASRED